MSNFIRYYDNMLTKDECDELINYTKDIYSLFCLNTESHSIDRTLIKKTLGKGSRFYYRVNQSNYSENQKKLIDGKWYVELSEVAEIIGS